MSTLGTIEVSDEMTIGGAPHLINKPWFFFNAVDNTIDIEYNSLHNMVLLQ
mgnify:CR=1 FL=1|jgi:hypothetical protein